MKIMSPMSTFPIQKSEFRILLFNGSVKPCKCAKITNSWTMSMDSRFSSTVNGNSDMKNNKKKKEELSVSMEVSISSIPKVEEGTLRSDGLRFDRLQPSDYELVRERRFEFGQFVARDAVLDEEYWTAAWLRAESHWENRTYESVWSQVYQVRKEQKNVKRSIIKSVVGTLDLNIRYLLQGETFPGERVKTPFSCSTNRTPPSRYGYIANLCVTKSARRQGIASNMMYFAVESAKSNGVRQVYVHVDRNNMPAQLLYQKMGFEMVETANSRLLLEKTYLLRLLM
ncbi:hypothetical protein RYX36_002660 [Vicia faba]